MRKMAMVVGGLMALVLLVGVGVLASGPDMDVSGSEKDIGGENIGSGDILRLREGTCAREGEPTGEPTQTREQLKDGSCVQEGEPTGEPTQIREQSREQLKDGSCVQEGEPTGEPTQTQEQSREQQKDGTCSDEADEEAAAVESDGVCIHDRDRDQVNGGTGPQYRYGN